MKFFLIPILLLSLNPVSLRAQDYTYPLDKITKVFINAKISVRIKSHNEPILLIKESENYKSKKPKKSEGLQSIFRKGRDNTNYGVEVREENADLFVTSLLNRESFELILYLPKQMNIYVESLLNNDIFVTGFSSEIVAKNQTGDIILNDLTGPVVAENRDGNVEVVFSTLNQSSPTSIVAVNGDIEIKMPSNTKANITSKIPMGDFFTNFDFNPSIKKNARTKARTVTGKLNEGGVEIFLQTLKGNIYLRKIK